MRTKYLIFILFLLQNALFFAQYNTNFSDYKTLQSQGTIPDDIKLSTAEKIQRDLLIDRPDLPKQYRERFYKGIHHSIDDVLRSDVCIFGDPISNYLKEIAQKLLSNDMETFNKLRFYTLKTNETNAFSTDQGIIFFTTGFISQVSTEAQIAYVLAHEISHYKRQHVLERFLKNTKLTTASYVELSSYSKERELEADADAIELYKHAGYSMDLIEPTFDVLMYSYLPFDEMKIPQDFFNSNQFLMPKFKFPTDNFAITAEENYNDSKSSHPNISKRKKQVIDVLDKSTTWKGKDFLLGEERFTEIRNMARFEAVRNSIVELDLTNAIYSIYILKKEFPNSRYLDAMNAKAWLTLAQAKNLGMMKPFESKLHKEGEIATLHAIFRKFEKLEASSVALRQIYDIQLNYPKDQEIQGIYERMIETASRTKQFELKVFSKMGYNQALERNKAFNDSIANIPVDSTKLVTIDTKESKYEKIKKKRSADGIIESEVFDTTRYYLYGMADIINDSTFAQTFRTKFNSTLSEKNSDKEENNGLIPAIPKLQSKSIALVDAKVETLETSPSTLKIAANVEKSVNELINKEAQKNGYNISTDNAPNNLSVEGINTFMYIKTALRQSKNAGKLNFFPVDYLELQKMKVNYASDVVLIPTVLYSNDIKSDPMEIVRPVLSTWYVPPMALIFMTGKLLNAKTTYVSFIGIDLTTGHSESSAVYHVTGHPSKVMLGSMFHEIFQSTK